MPGEISLKEPQFLDVTVVVDGTGTGSAIALGNGHAERTVIDGPDGAHYDFYARCKDDKPLTAQAGIVDDFVFLDCYPMKERTKIGFANATPGTYLVRIWLQ